ncbi:putative SIR2 family histone deacetylase [Aspergillus nomiae NRRL 13137]|uniref:Putative SIR2 family histone deacetylase n=1 Tax=Aspergillus nomiae NRRL (strain ATCC 15546 / NRRL 13137 / CBS 260.88 / M93) TaxID=1509407 RepID=A0A0L1J262_ASPN3|nr:putative SIR2 family histone deacetylase [Aspergillus nomiae NRRL 13137]KNG85488.1 putative SIR2 family histone deacetylase [Aspergillus nomiae NRRL 13137]
MAPSAIPAADLRTFSEYLKGCKRILALLGAGISASSGLPTFRGAGGLWRTYDATELATPEAFEANPDLVWQFYNYRRHMALKAEPNRAHYALAELAKRNKNFITLSQNVDGNYSRENDFTDPIVPALAIPKNAPEPKPSTDDKTGEEASKSVYNALGIPEGEEVDISDDRVPLARLSPDVLPHCPECKDGLLRPGVVWFGESLPSQTLNVVDSWMRSGPIDLILVIGTSSRVYPAAGYVDKARARGARVAVVNMDRNDVGSSGLKPGDWFFKGDAGTIVPEILKETIGEI